MPSPSSVTYRRLSSDAIAVDVNASESGYVRVLESWDDGWTATVDGQPADVVPGDDTLWVDDSQHTGNARLSDLLLLEGTRVARSRLETAQPVRGWAALVSGGLDAGRTIAVPTKRALFIGRSPQADLTVDSASASWSHATVEHAVETVGEEEEPEYACAECGFSDDEASA